LGVECTLVTCVANDEAGKIVTSILEVEGVRLVQEVSDHTSVNTVLVNGMNGSRTVIKDIDSGTLEKKIQNKIIDSADLILCDRHEPDIVHDAIGRKKRGVQVIMDPSVDCSVRTMELLRNVSVPIVPIETMKTLFPNNTIQDGAKKLSLALDKTVIITMGEYGCAVCNRESFAIHSPPRVNVIDTLGAGDIFRGGFAFGVLNGWDLDRTVQFANMVAAMQCTKLGNSTAIPTKQEINTFQKTTNQLANSISLV
jgi:sugar/nucleoside kinase (ribokinase family)